MITQKDVDDAKAEMERAYSLIPAYATFNSDPYVSYVKAKGYWGLLSQQLKTQKWRERNASENPT